jgi:membrane protein implicated in regulation of membrane protease activity
MPQIEQLLAHFDHWSWWVTALVFFGVELALPGVFFLWLGIAAVITGFVALIAPGLGWQMDCLVFAVVAVVSTVIGRRYWKPAKTASADPNLNHRTAHYIGQVFTLDAPVVNGQGRLAVGDGTWLITGPDLPAGAKVRVTGAEGARLIVESA